MSVISPSDSESALRRAAVISLLTWRRAGPDDPVDDAELYGWWGDSFPSLAGDRIGSRLYLLRRRTITPDSIRDAQDYAREALQWMLDDGHVSAVAITTTRSVSRLDMHIKLTTPNGAEIDVTLDDIWQVIHAV